MGADAGVLADAARREGIGGVVTRLKPQTRVSPFSGRALTAHLGYTPHKAALLERVAPGVVVVLDMGEPQSTGIGEIMATYLAGRGAAGAVFNGLVRDAEAIDVIGMPVFSLGVGIGTRAGCGQFEAIDEPVWPKESASSPSTSLRAAEEESYAYRLPTRARSVRLTPKLSPATVRSSKRSRAASQRHRSGSGTKHRPWTSALQLGQLYNRKL